MNRRFFLKLLGAAGVAVVAAPKAVLARALDQPTIGPPIVPVKPVTDGLQTIRISFPDGTTWQMRGYVRSQMVDSPIDGVSTSTVEFQPSGPCECVDELRPESHGPNVTVDGSPVKRLRGEPTQRGQARTARATKISLDGEALGEVQDITLPHVHQEVIDVTRDPRWTGMPDDHREYVHGLKRVSPLTFTVNFDGKVLLP